MAYKVITNVDKFDNRTSTEMNEKYDLEEKAFSSKLLVRYLSTPDIEGAFLDYYYCKLASDYLYTAGGEMTIRINDMENLKLAFLGGGDRHSGICEEFTVVHEYNWVGIDKATLEKICEAKSLEIRVKGKYIEDYSAEQCQGFIEYCRIFYNSLYQTDKYIIQGNLKTQDDMEELEKRKLQEREKKEKESKTALIVLGILLALIGIIIFSAADFSSADSGFGVAILFSVLFFFTGFGLFVYGLVK